MELADKKGMAMKSMNHGQIYGPSTSYSGPQEKIP